MKLLTTIFFAATLMCSAQEKPPVKLGLGLVGIADTYAESKTVALYRDKDLKNKIQDFKLYGALKTIQPIFLKPDYGICYFVCLEKTKNYYKVLINDTEEGFLKN